MSFFDFIHSDRFTSLDFDSITRSQVRGSFTLNTSIQDQNSIVGSRLDQDVTLSVNYPSFDINLTGSVDVKTHSEGTNKADFLIGTQNADQLKGLEGNDFLFGAGGNDLLDGGLGSDRVVGGRGADQFVLRRGNGTDTIFDYQGGIDSFLLAAGLTFENLTIVQGTGSNIASTLIRDRNTRETLAVVFGVSSSTITEQDFQYEEGGTAGRYRLTKIADTKDAFNAFEALPAINDQGTVVFQAMLGGVEGVFTSNGGAVTTIADTRGELSDFTFINPEINNQGTVVFFAALDDGGAGLFRSDNGITTPIASGQGFRAADVDINNQGTIAFSGALQPDERSSLYFVENGALNKIAGADGAISRIDGSDLRDISELDLNDSNAVVFTASNFEDMPGTYLIQDSAAERLPGFGSGVAINDRGVVVFSNDGISKYLDGVTTPLVDTSGLFAHVNYPAINNNDQIIFTAAFDSSNPADRFDSGIFSGADPVNDRVVYSRDIIEGSSVWEVIEGPADNALNNQGQFVFVVRFRDGNEALYRADPIF